MDIARLCVETPARRFELLGSSESGLSAAEAANRRHTFGANAIGQATTSSRARRFRAHFTHPLALLLWFGAGMAFAARTPELAAAIIAVIAANGLFAYVQEMRADRVVEALLARAAISTHVVREGHEHELSATELVPGDLIVLTAGDVVPADCALVRADALSLDLSMLTGETTPVDRSAEVLREVDTADVTRIACMAPAGSGVLTGNADAIVVATGRASTMGRIVQLLEGATRSRSLLERQVIELSRFTMVVAVTCGIGILIAAVFLRGTEIIAALVFGTGVIASLVPEGLLPLLTVTLALGARRLAERGALVRRLPAIEAIGSTTVVGTDKTGTLTRNEVDVVGLVPWQPAPDAEQRAKLVAVLCNDCRPANGGEIGDPIDHALVRWCRREGMDVARIRGQHPRTYEVPFDPHRRYMRVDCRFDDGERMFLKGAPEAIAAVLHVEIPPELANLIAAAASRGERVLMLAEGRNDEGPHIVGLLRLQDPPRPEVPTAVAACLRAGIRVIMFTGDHPATAKGIALRIGLASESTPVIEATTLDAMDDDALLLKLRETAILARTTPEQKLRIVRVLQSDGNIVTVTGDGVNDAPALRRADVGIAMGRGTEIAKQASDVILFDENFATIVAAIEQGRGIKKNIQKFISYVSTSDVAELVPFICYVLLPIPLPLTILQVLAIDLGTDVFPALALGLERPAPRTLDVPPEPPGAPLLGRGLAVRTFLFYGLLEAALGMAGFLAVYWAHGWRPFESFAPFEAAQLEAGTLTFLAIVGGQIGCLFVLREGSPRARFSLLSNPWIAIGLGFELALALALVYVPGINTVFTMTEVAPGWLTAIPIGAAIMILADVLRRALLETVRRSSPSQHGPRT